jgi:hypothetical protein
LKAAPINARIQPMPMLAIRNEGIRISRKKKTIAAKTQ